MAEPDIGRGETPAIRTRSVLVVTIAMLAALVAIAVGLQVFFSDRIGMTIVATREFPAPGVVSGERAERLALEAKQNSELNGAAGRMPIAAAMQAIAAKGLRAFDPIEAAR